MTTETQAPDPAQAAVMAELLEIVRITIGNVRSLGPAGALAPVHTPYREWLAELEAVYAKASSLGSAQPSNQVATQAAHDNAIYERGRQDGIRQARDIAAVQAPEGAQLPPLPHPLLIAGGGQSWFNAEQMHAYARAALAAPAPQAPVALTGEQVTQLMMEINSTRDARDYSSPLVMFTVIVRAVEEAHGITQTKEPKA